jgi:hypothetical protein
MREEKHLFACFQMICLLKKSFFITNIITQQHLQSLDDTFAQN